MAIERVSQRRLVDMLTYLARPEVIEAAKVPHRQLLQHYSLLVSGFELPLITRHASLACSPLAAGAGAFMLGNQVADPAPS